MTMTQFKQQSTDRLFKAIAKVLNDYRIDIDQELNEDSIVSSSFNEIYNIATFKFKHGELKVYLDEKNQCYEIYSFIWERDRSRGLGKKSVIVYMFNNDVLSVSTVNKFDATDHAIAKDFNPKELIHETIRNVYVSQNLTQYTTLFLNGNITYSFYYGIDLRGIYLYRVTTDYDNGVKTVYVNNTTIIIPLNDTVFHVYDGATSKLVVTSRGAFEDDEKILYEGVI